jgi:hypothetical protein
MERFISLNRVIEAAIHGADETTETAGNDGSQITHHRFFRSLRLRSLNPVASNLSPFRASPEVLVVPIASQVAANYIPSADRSVSG